MMHLTTLADYEVFIYSLQDRFPAILRTTLTVIHRGRDTAEVRGDVEFEGALRLGVREYLRFDLKPPPTNTFIPALSTTVSLLSVSVSPVPTRRL